MQPFVTKLLILLLSTVICDGQKFKATTFIKSSAGQNSCTMLFVAASGGGKSSSDIADRIDGCVPEGSTDGCNYKERRCGGSVSPRCAIDTEREELTILIAGRLQEVVEEQLQDIPCKPHFLFSTMHKSEVDLNTLIEAGAQGDENGKDLYKKFHEKIEKIKKTESTGFLGERGIIFDIHGKNNSDSHTDFGYILGYDRLIEILDGTESNQQRRYSSTFRLLRENDMLSMRDFLFGGNSLGGLLEAQEGDFKALPSPSLPENIMATYEYQSGYRIIKRHSSKRRLVNTSNTDAVSIAIPAQVRVLCPGDDGGSFDQMERDNCAREKYTVALGKAIAQFYRNMYI